MVLSKDFLYPLEDADLSLLQTIGYSGVRVAYRAFSALAATVFKKGGLSNDRITIYTFESAASLLINRFYQVLEKDLPSAKMLSIKDRDTGLLPENIITTLEQGLDIAIRIREEHLAAFDRHLSLLKQYFGRYQYAVTVSHTNSTGWRVHHLDIKHSDEMPFFINYGLASESMDVQYLELNPFTRLVMRKSTVLGTAALSVQVEDRHGKEWHQQAQPRTFPMTPAMSNSAVQLASWLLGTFASSDE
jgi:hypothetical protein